MPSASFLAHRDTELQGTMGPDIVWDREDSERQSAPQLLDPLTPDHFTADFDWVMAEMAAGDAFRATKDTLWCLDVDHTIHRPTCIVPTARNGEAVRSRLWWSNRVAPRLPLPPSLVPQDGHEKQDCERAAVKPLAGGHHARYQPYTVTYLGDDLYANQPDANSCRDLPAVFVRKPDSHVALYDEVALLDKISGGLPLMTRHDGRSLKSAHFVARHWAR